MNNLVLKAIFASMIFTRIIFSEQRPCFPNSFPDSKFKREIQIGTQTDSVLKTLGEPYVKKLFFKCDNQFCNFEFYGKVAGPLNMTKIEADGSGRHTTGGPLEKQMRGKSIEEVKKLLKMPFREYWTYDTEEDHCFMDNIRVLEIKNDRVVKKLFKFADFDLESILK